MDMENDEKIRNKTRDQLWRTQCLPKFQVAGLSEEQIDAAMRMFNSGFECGWEGHKAHLVKQYIAESQKQKVHLA